MAKVIFVVDHENPTFEAARTAIDVVCAGDSITGWNNFRPPDMGMSRDERFVGFYAVP